ncbi:MAG: hypothetical protein R3F21_13690 [Myxococcota bacterium]
MSRGEGDPITDRSGAAEVAALAARWPRALIERGEAERLSTGWVASRRAAVAAGRPALAEHPLRPPLVAALFEARRARRLVRGLEAAETALEAQRRGVGAIRSSARAASPAAPERISRLLLISSDGSERFYRGVERLRQKYGAVIEVIRIVCDELELGAGVFGPGKRVRALLVDHKDAVIRVLEALDWLATAEPGEEPEIEPEAGGSGNAGADPVRDGSPSAARVST